MSQLSNQSYVETFDDICVNTIKASTIMLAFIEYVAGNIYGW